MNRPLVSHRCWTREYKTKATTTINFSKKPDFVCPTYFVFAAVPGVEVVDEVCVSLVKQRPDRGRVLSDPAHLPLPHAVVEKRPIEAGVHMTTKL